MKAILLVLISLCPLTELVVCVFIRLKKLSVLVEHSELAAHTYLPAGQLERLWTEA